LNNLSTLSIVGSSIATNYLTGSTLLISSIGLNNLSTLSIVASSITTNYFTGSTLVVSSIALNTISTAQLNISSINTNTHSTNQLLANTIIGSTLTASSITTNYLTGSTLYISSIGLNNLSTLSVVASSIATNYFTGSTLVVSSIALNTISTAQLNVSSINTNVHSTNQLLANSITGCTITISTIGINCNAPQYALDVNGTIRAASINAAAATNVSTILYAGGFTTNANTASLLFQTQGGGGGTVEQRIQSRYAGTTYGLSIDDILNSKTDNLRITNGKVGINCNAPLYGLDVNGTANFNGAVTMPNLPAGNSLITTVNQINLVSNPAGPYFWTQTTTSNLRIGCWNTSALPITINEQGSGSVGIWTTAPSPSYALDVNGSVRATGANSVFGSTYKVYVGDTTGQGGTGYSLYATNNIYAAGGVINTSDQRVKLNIEDANLSMCYSTFQQLNLRRFQWDSNYFPSTIKQDARVLGFIAQEVKTVLPKAVYVNDDIQTGLSSFHALNAEQINYTHFGATQYLAQKIEALEQQQQQSASTILGMQMQISTMLAIA